MKNLIFIGSSLLFLVWQMGCAPTFLEKGRLVASEDVAAPISQKARSLAEKQLILQKSLKTSRVVFVGVELARQKTKDGKDPERKRYRVIHYRYDDDTAIHTLVDLEGNQMLDQQEIPHLSTSLAQEELALSRKLALKDPKVRKALGKDVDRVHVEALVIRTASEKDPWYGRRILQLLFKVGRDYLIRPNVVVDLTHNKVLMDREGGQK